MKREAQYFDTTLTVTNNSETIYFFGSFYNMFRNARMLTEWFNCEWSIIRDEDGVVLAKSKKVSNEA